LSTWWEIEHVLTSDSLGIQQHAVIAELNLLTVEKAKQDIQDARLALAMWTRIEAKDNEEGLVHRRRVRIERTRMIR